MLTIEVHYFKDLPMLLHTHPKLVLKKLDLNKVFFLWQKITKIIFNIFLQNLFVTFCKLILFFHSNSAIATHKRPTAQ
jgi:hypothetical protein